MAKKAKKSKVKKVTKNAPKAVAPKNQSGIQPIGDRVLVKREEVETTSPAGIIIPDTASKEKSKRGVVIAVGTGRFGDEGDLIPMTVKAGDKVYFNAGWDNEIKLPGDDAEYFLIHENEILAVIN
jgi:chaperonin GroES